MIFLVAAVLLLAEAVAALCRSAHIVEDLDCASSGGRRVQYGFGAVDHRSKSLHWCEIGVLKRRWKDSTCSNAGHYDIAEDGR